MKRKKTKKPHTSAAQMGAAQTDAAQSRQPQTSAAQTKSNKMNPILKRIITALTVAAVLVLAIIYLPPVTFAPIAAAFAALALCEYWKLLAIKIPPRSKQFAFFFVEGAAVICLALATLPIIAFTMGNLMMLFVILLVKLSDMGGFAFGLSSEKLMKGGNHKLCPTISPGKSWEGLFGSVVGSCVIAFSFMPITKFSEEFSFVLGVVAALVGTFGDLVESKFKRWVGVKDSSTMKFTNGMGGVLDMIDSLLFAPLVIFLLIRFCR